MTIIFNSTMLVIPETMPWRLFINTDECIHKQKGEDFSLKLCLEYGTTQHILIDSDVIRTGIFFDAVGLIDVKECFESIIFETSLYTTNPECKCIPLDRIIEQAQQIYRQTWSHQYKLVKGQ